MKNNLLISHRWKTLGWILAVPAFFAGIYLMYLDSPDDYFQVTVPRWLEGFLWVDDGFWNSTVKPTTLSLLDEVICISLLLGLLLLAFSKEKIEDEWIQRVRLESLQWAILINTLLLIAFTIFMHGFIFVAVMELNMFTPLLVFVGRFYYVLRIKPSFSKQ
ncbi:MAG: hypothetical protein SGI94_23060 [Saprospiraceae bacterium]|mgnify:CR=1 FL=1|nr:hypothetical protein [Saprospiraceae bacterium]